jgi:hypothetical protein
MLKSTALLLCIVLVAATGCVYRTHIYEETETREKVIDSQIVDPGDGVLPTPKPAPKTKTDTTVEERVIERKIVVE